MYSNPSYDPNPLAGHDTDVVTDYGDLLQADPSKPDLPRAYREIFPPGSTFKAVTATVGLETGVTTPDTVYPSITALPLPLTNSTIANFGNQSCGGTLFQSFTKSCNTTFAKIGLDLGEQFPPGMSRFGIYSVPPLDVAPGAVASSGPQAGTFQTDAPRYALAGIGQGDVAVTPLQMALVAAAIANGGVIMQPHVADEITDQDDNVIRRISPADVDDRDRSRDRGGGQAHDDRRRRERHRHGGADRGHHRRGQDGHRPDREREQDPARVVHLVRAGRGPAGTRWR